MLWALPFIFLGVRAQALEMTIYQDQRALIKEEAVFSLQAGISQTPSFPVPWGFEPSSVLISPVNPRDNASVLEQDFFGGWTNEFQVLKNFIGKGVELREEKFPAPIKGVLLEAEDHLTALKVKNQVYLNPKGTWILPAPPKASFQPVVSWKIRAKNSGNYRFKISYLTRDVTWGADYAAIIDSSSNLMELQVWANLDNQSGIDFKKAHVLLVAGNPHQSLAALSGSHPLFHAMAAASRLIIEKSQNLFEYHLYPLPGFVNLGEGSVRLSIGEASGVPVEKKYLYDASNLGEDFSAYTRISPDYGTQSQGEVRVVFKLRNSKASHLGFPLPPGKIRMYQKDKDGALEWIGSDSLPATPINEELHVNAGRAFDVLGRRVRMNFERGPKNTRESFEITLTNHKKSDVVVEVIEHLYRWSKWKIISSNQKWEKKDAQTIVFEIPVKKDSSSQIDYTVDYNWK